MEPICAIGIAQTIEQRNFPLPPPLKVNRLGGGVLNQIPHFRKKTGDWASCEQLFDNHYSSTLFCFTANTSLSPSSSCSSMYAPSTGGESSRRVVRVSDAIYSPQLANTELMSP